MLDLRCTTLIALAAALLTFGRGAACARRSGRR